MNNTNSTKTGEFRCSGKVIGRLSAYYAKENHMNNQMVIHLVVQDPHLLVTNILFSVVWSMFTYWINTYHHSRLSLNLFPRLHLFDTIQLMTFDEVNTRIDEPIEHDIYRCIQDEYHVPWIDQSLYSPKWKVINCFIIWH